MIRRLVIISLLLVPAFGLGWLWRLRVKPPLETKFIQPNRPQATATAESAGFSDLPEELNGASLLKSPGESFTLRAPRQVFQTFNNCGPATLSMILSWYGVEVSQRELGEKMRPYQNPKGDDDDKTIFTHEFAQWAQRYGLQAVSRVNGTTELLKLLVTNEIPVVVKTWLRPNEDIGHFRIIRGFDEAAQVVVQDDSYHGPNRRIAYYDFLSMWQPFNYAYIIVYPQEKEGLVRAILGAEWVEAVAWRRALERAREEEGLDPGNVYPLFNQAASHYHLGDYQGTVQAFERVEASLPRRMLWYQIEPILAYQRLGQDDRVFAIADRLLSGGNRAFSELYQIRGEIYLAQGDPQRARAEFELALTYNRSFEPAQQALAALASP